MRGDTPASLTRLRRTLRGLIFGDRREVACIPHAVGRLEIVAPQARTARSTFSGQVIRYTHSFLLGDRFVMPGGRLRYARHVPEVARLV